MRVVDLPHVFLQLQFVPVDDDVVPASFEPELEFFSNQSRHAYRITKMLINADMHAEKSKFGSWR